MGKQGDKETGGPAVGDETHLPECTYRYFWDIDPADLDVSEYPRYVIGRPNPSGSPVLSGWWYRSCLVYFEDAEADPMPDMLKPVPWPDVRRFFEQEAQDLFRRL